MTKIAVVFAPGFEEVEALIPVDVLRRADLTVDMIGFEHYVTGSHHITVQTDHLLTEQLADYDVIILPGGLPGATHLRDNAIVIDSVQQVAKRGGIVAAICAAPIALDRAGLLTDKQYTCFPGIEEQITSGNHQSDALTITDQGIITARGAGAGFEFAFAILEALGIDSQPLRNNMQYTAVTNAYQQQ